MIDSNGFGVLVLVIAFAILAATIAELTRGRHQ